MEHHYSQLIKCFGIICFYEYKNGWPAVSKLELICPMVAFNNLIIVPYITSSVNFIKEGCEKMNFRIRNY